MRQTYRSYGLTLLSDLPISGLNPLPNTTLAPDIQLDFSKIPSWAVQAQSLPITSVRVAPSPNPSENDSFTVSEFADRRFFQLTYGDGTRFLMDRGATRLWGQAGPGLSHDDVCVYVLGPVMGFMLRQRGRTTLHASALCFQDRAIAFVGEAGAGKSTTAAALALRGWPVLCEDVCALEQSSGEYRVQPAYPRVCLWPDSVDFLLSSRDALPVIVRGWEKRFLPLGGSRAHFAANSAPLAAIFLIASRSDDNAAPRFEPISQREALLQLVQNTYMNWYLDRRQRADEFESLARLIVSVECFRLIPSADPARLPALADIIEMQTSRLLSVGLDPLGTASRNV